MAVAKPARLGVGLTAVCSEVSESLSAILNRAYKHHQPQGGSGPCSLGFNRRSRLYLKNGSGGSSSSTYHCAPMGPLITPHAQWPSSGSTCGV